MNETLFGTLIHDVSQDRITTNATTANNLRAINGALATTRNLSPEILSIIFELACPPIDFKSRFWEWKPGLDIFHAQDNTFHLTLAAVCQYWRGVVLSTARLWTRITLRPNKPGHSVETEISFLNFYLDRARGLPISIELNCHGEKVQWLACIEEPVEVNEGLLACLEPLKKAIFVDNASRIHHLSLIQAPTNWFPFMNENLSQCTYLALYDPMDLIEVEGKGESDENDRNEDDREEIMLDPSQYEEIVGEYAPREIPIDSPFHEDDGEFLLDLDKVPLLEHIDLVSLPRMYGLLTTGSATRLRIRHFEPLWDTMSPLEFVKYLF